VHSELGVRAQHGPTPHLGRRVKEARRRPAWYHIQKMGFFLFGVQTSGPTNRNQVASHILQKHRGYGQRLPARPCVARPDAVISSGEERQSAVEEGAFDRSILLDSLDSTGDAGSSSASGPQQWSSSSSSRTIGERAGAEGRVGSYRRQKRQVTVTRDTWGIPKGKNVAWRGFKCTKPPHPFRTAPLL
jgi:hypothetical protein